MKADVAYFAVAFFNHDIILEECLDGTDEFQPRLRSWFLFHFSMAGGGGDKRQRNQFFFAPDRIAVGVTFARSTHAYAYALLRSFFPQTNLH